MYGGVSDKQKQQEENSRWSREPEISKLMTYVYAFVCIYRNVSYAVVNRIEHKRKYNKVDI